jgi:mediator of RNA polymerase II transcription subunit 31
VCGLAPVLAAQGYLLDGKFIRYLDYLQYWKEPQYAKFLVYPHCLRFLDLLQHEEIRKLLTEDRTFHLKLLDQQFYHWLYRRRHTQQAKAPEGSGGASAQKPAAAQQPAAGASATGPR